MKEGEKANLNAMKFYTGLLI